MASHEQQRSAGLKSYQDVVVNCPVNERPARRATLRSRVIQLLCLVVASFRFPKDVSEVLRYSIEKMPNWCPDKASKAFKCLEDYALNILDCPWKPEFRTIKTYSGFYTSKITRYLPNADKLLERLGYRKFIDDTLLLEISFSNETQQLREHKLVEFAYDMFVAGEECTMYAEIHQHVSRQGFDYTHIYQCRTLIAGDAISCRDWIFANCVPDKRWLYQSTTTPMIGSRLQPVKGFFSEHTGTVVNVGNENGLRVHERNTDSRILSRHSIAGENTLPSMADDIHATGVGNDKIHSKLNTDVTTEHTILDTNKLGRYADAVLTIKDNTTVQPEPDDRTCLSYGSSLPQFVEATADEHQISSAMAVNALKNAQDGKLQHDVSMPVRLDARSDAARYDNHSKVSVSSLSTTSTADGNHNNVQMTCTTTAAIRQQVPQYNKAVMIDRVQDKHVQQRRYPEISFYSSASVLPENVHGPNANLTKLSQHNGEYSNWPNIAGVKQNDANYRPHTLTTKQMNQSELYANVPEVPLEQRKSTYNADSVKQWTTSSQGRDESDFAGAVGGREVHSRSGQLVSRGISSPTKLNGATSSETYNNQRLSNSELQQLDLDRKAAKSQPSSTWSDSHATSTIDTATNARHGDRKPEFIKSSYTVETSTSTDDATPFDGTRSKHPMATTSFSSALCNEEGRPLTQQRGDTGSGNDAGAASTRQQKDDDVEALIEILLRVNPEQMSDNAYRRRVMSHMEEITGKRQ